MIKGFQGLLYQMLFIDQGRLCNWKDFCHKHFVFVQQFLLVHDLLNDYFWIQIDSYKKHCFVQGTYRACHGLFFQLFYWCLRVRILVYNYIVTSVLQPSVLQPLGSLYRTALPLCLLDLNGMCLQLDCISNLDISYVSSPYICLFVLVFQKKIVEGISYIFMIGCKFFVVADVLYFWGTFLLILIISLIPCHTLFSFFLFSSKNLL